MRFLRPRLLLVLLPFLTAACGGGGSTPSSPSLPSAPYSQTDLVVGTGAEAASGRTVLVAYSGWLFDSTKPESKGTFFDTSTAFSTQIGVGRVIAGWDRGVPGMKVGGKRLLVVPPELGYGSRGAPPTIPPNATLLFEITLLAVQ